MLMREMVHVTPPPLTPSLCLSLTRTLAQLLGDHGESNFAIVFAAMGVNMETARFFKQVCARVRVCQVYARAGGWMGG
jgi:hypothetical protein